MRPSSLPPPLPLAASHADSEPCTRSLTDDVSRRNYELYGHPDGKQEFSSGIALPAWIVESKNSPFVIGAYALLLGVVLPVLVVRPCSPKPSPSSRAHC